MRARMSAHAIGACELHPLDLETKRPIPIEYHNSHRHPVADAAHQNQNGVDLIYVVQ